MDRFFFHISSMDELIPDANGREFGDLAAAHRHAMLLIHKMVMLDDLDWRGWSIKVTDAGGRSMLSVLFPQACCFRFGNEPGRPKSRCNWLMADTRCNLSRQRFAT
jgi:Domain of unknown function (DUF6894)